MTDLGARDSFDAYLQLPKAFPWRSAVEHRCCQDIELSAAVVKPRSAGAFASVKRQELNLPWLRSHTGFFVLLDNQLSMEKLELEERTGASV